jgi:DNA-binding CsgD family transcriptional regulator
MATLEQNAARVSYDEEWNGQAAVASHSSSWRRFRRNGSPAAWSPSPEALTRREVDVLRLLAKGNTNRQAADVLGLSVRTVENHRANLKGKLGAASRVELVSYAAAHDLT